MAQRCVDPLQESVGAVDFSMFDGRDTDEGRVGYKTILSTDKDTELVTLAGARWLIFDDARTVGEDVWPVLAATHDHRHCRGRVIVGGK